MSSLFVQFNLCLSRVLKASNFSLKFFLMCKLLDLSSILLIMLLLNHLLLLILFGLLLKDNSVLLHLLFLSLFILFSLDLNLLLWLLVGFFDIFGCFIGYCSFGSFFRFNFGNSLLLLLLGGILFQLLFLKRLFIFLVGLFLILVEFIETLLFDLEVHFVLFVKLALFLFNTFLIFLSLFFHCFSFGLIAGSFFKSRFGSNLLILNILFNWNNSLLCLLLLRKLRLLGRVSWWLSWWRITKFN